MKLVPSLKKKNHIESIFGFCDDKDILILLIYHTELSKVQTRSPFHALMIHLHGIFKKFKLY